VLVATIGLATLNPVNAQLCNTAPSSTNPPCALTAGYAGPTVPLRKPYLKQSPGSVAKMVVQTGMAVSVLREAPCLPAFRQFHLSPKRLKTIFATEPLHGKDIPGIGIGLAICQRVVYRYGGRIWVESQLNQGATFYCTLPTATGASA
jgi:hypothetical protein